MSCKCTTSCKQSPGRHFRLCNEKAGAEHCRVTPNFDAIVVKPFVAFWKLVTGLLNPISDGVGRDVILLGQVARANVVLQHLPHDPSALLRREGRGADGAEGKKGG